MGDDKWGIVCDGDGLADVVAGRLGQCGPALGESQGGREWDPISPALAQVTSDN